MWCQNLQGLKLSAKTLLPFMIWSPTDSRRESQAKGVWCLAHPPQKWKRKGACIRRASKVTSSQTLRCCFCILFDVVHILVMWYVFTFPRCTAYCVIFLFVVVVVWFPRAVIAFVFLAQLALLSRLYQTNTECCVKGELRPVMCVGKLAGPPAVASTHLLRKNSWIKF